MLGALARRWWLLAGRGIAAIAFGVMTFIRPGSSLIVLVLLFGAYALVDGAFNLGFAFRVAGAPRWGLLVVGGVASIVAGILTFIWPAMTALVLVTIIAVWAVVIGITTIVTGVRLRQQMRGEWLMVGSGILSVALGVLLFLYPGPGALAMVIWIGAYAIVFGALNLFLAFRLRALGGIPDKRIPTGGVPVGT